MEKNNKKEQFFEEMSHNFQRAFGLAGLGFYHDSISLYKKALFEDKDNFSALNNIAVAKIYVGVEQKDKKLLEEAITNLKEAIRIANEVYNYPDGYPFAQANLDWAEEELTRLIHH